MKQKIITIPIIMVSACTPTIPVNKISYLINQEISEFEKQLTTNTNITPFTTTKANYLEKTTITANTIPNSKPQTPQYQKQPKTNKP